MSDPVGRLLSPVYTGDTGGREIPVLEDKGSTGFADTLRNVLNEASDVQERSADYIARFTRGEPVELHEVMAATEEAGLSLELLIEVRNKFIEAYRTIINMQS